MVFQCINKMRKEKKKHLLMKHYKTYTKKQNESTALERSVIKLVLLTLLLSIFVWL